MSVKKVGKVWAFRVDAGIDDRARERKQIYRSRFKTKREAIFTGMRRGEILALRWKNVDLEKGVIHVEESLARTKANGLFVKTVKTSHSERDVYLSASLRETLTEYRQQQKPNELGLVVASKACGYLEPRNLLRKFQSLTKKANVPKIRFHNLRHTHATLLMRMGENPKVVSERLGHARVGITLYIYSHTNEEMQNKTADRFDDRFWTKRNKRANNGTFTTVRQINCLVHFLCSNCAIYKNTEGKCYLLKTKKKPKPLI